MIKYLALCLGSVALLVAALVLPGRVDPGPALRIEQEGRNPWTNLALNNRPGLFQFAIVSDRTGGHRPKIFSQTVDRLNYLQPEFVISVGDLIEGGSSKKEKQLAGEWEEFDGFVKKLQMPFFYVPGNHDTGAKTSAAVWTKRLGRRHYHFRYRDVLFLVLNTEDPPGSGRGHIGKGQLADVRQALEANKDVRWTLVFLHKPIWLASDLEKAGWLAVEKALADRPYTVFCGHLHRYKKYFRQGRAYYQLATTGGVSRIRGTGYGEFDHIVWVTMKKDGPVLANLRVEAILPKDLREPESSEPGISTKSRKPTHRVIGRVYYKGSPVPEAVIAFHSVTKKGERGIRADGLVEADGSFVLSTYKAFDGAPAGEYEVTVTWRRPFYTAEGGAGPNLLPARYADQKKSGLKATVKPGPNAFTFNLKE
jgi:hypothetical protein